MVKAVFLDRDGVINQLVNRGTKQVAPWLVKDFAYINGSIDAVQQIKLMGYTTHVVTNQPDVDDGLMTEDSLNTIMSMIKLDMNVTTISVARTRNTDDYKPNNGMIEKIINEFKVTRQRSIMIGDSWKDIVAGNKSGLITIFIGEDYTCPDEKYKHIKPDYMRDSLIDSISLIRMINNTVSDAL